MMSSSSYTVSCSRSMVTGTIIPTYFHYQFYHVTYGTNAVVQLPFYRAMHFSAKRGIAIACRLSVRLSVRPSVCDVGEL